MIWGIFFWQCVYLKRDLTVRDELPVQQTRGAAAKLPVLVTNAGEGWPAAGGRGTTGSTRKQKMWKLKKIIIKISQGGSPDRRKRQSMAWSLLYVPVKCRLYWRRQRWRCAGNSRMPDQSERPMTPPTAGWAVAGTPPVQATGSTCCLHRGKLKKK